MTTSSILYRSRFTISGYRAGINFYTHDLKKGGVKINFKIGIDHYRSVGTVESSSGQFYIVFCIRFSRKPTLKRILKTINVLLSKLRQMNNIPAGALFLNIYVAIGSSNATPSNGLAFPI